MISIEDRLEYYIGGTKCTQKPPCIAHGYDEPIEINVETYASNYAHIHPHTEYPIDVNRYCKFSTKPRLWFQCGDSVYEGPEWPVMVKTRDTQKKDSKGIIINLNSLRHWREVLRSPDTPWVAKSSEIMWRGADTGHPHRLDFVKLFSAKHNVGFSRFVQEKRFHPDLYLDRYVKGMVSVQEMLRYKYLPVVDGNDKSSSLGWVMASDSVPIMPKPRYHSWMCEPWMKPDVHYIEVKRDWSDLEEKVKFLKANDEFARKVADNGKRFMLQFMNEKQERYIEEKIVEYINGIQGSA